MLFKKGDTAECDNYRPISISPIGYKLFAAILLQRLKKAVVMTMLLTDAHALLQSRAGPIPESRFDRELVYAGTLLANRLRPRSRPRVDALHRRMRMRAGCIIGCN